jgi:hypothetical protein
MDVIAYILTLQFSGYKKKNEVNRLFAAIKSIPIDTDEFMNH